MSTHTTTSEDRYIEEVVHLTRDSKIIKGVISLLIIAAVIAVIMFGILGNLATAP